MADKNFPKPYVDSVRQDDKLLEYVNNGDWSVMGIGARKSGLPKGEAAPHSGSMGIDHVGKNATK